MKVGDYVRYVDVFNNTIKIRKINKIIPPDKLVKKDVYFFNNKECSFKKDIIKSSPNIIDLIEVGDYVNGHRVNFIDGDREYFVISFGNDAYTLKSQFNDDIYWLAKEDIKSIVTKEQFESMEYKL